MKAIYISEYFDPKTDLEKLNRELKDTYSIESEIAVQSGRVIIVNNVTRKDKLQKIISFIDEKGTIDNGI